MIALASYWYSFVCFTRVSRLLGTDADTAGFSVEIARGCHLMNIFICDAARHFYLTTTEDRPYLESYRLGTLLLGIVTYGIKSFKLDYGDLFQDCLHGCYFYVSLTNLFIKMAVNIR